MMSGDLEKDAGSENNSTSRNESRDHSHDYFDKEIDERLELEKEDNSRPGSRQSPDASAANSQRTSSTASTDSKESDGQPASSAGRNVIQFEPGDLGNPYNWSSKKKAICILVEASTVINCTMGTALTAGGTDQLAEYFHVTDEYQLVCVTSIYLVGFVLGPLLFGPLSESYGRRNIMMGCFSIFSVFTLASALAPNWPALIIFRLITGMMASAPIAVVGGICADVYDDPVTRGRAMAVFMSSTAFGPCFGPIFSGYLAPISWRWMFWSGLIVAGASWILLVFMPETYGPILLKWRAQKLRKKTGDKSIVAPIELERTDIRQIVTVVLTRPFRMIIFEPIVSLTCIYLSLIYGIFYMWLQSFPIIFRGTYQFTAGEEGLVFISIGVGSIIACGIYIWWDVLLQRARAANKPWSRREESRRLPLGVFGGPCMVIAMFWIGWTATPNIHWIVPSIAGIWFGTGFLLMFMSLLNYIVDAYTVFAASAMAATSATRAVFGVVLPYSTRPMYDALGVPWACSLLGFLMLGMCFIAPLFWAYGHKLRARSPFCQHLLKQREKEEEAKRKAKPVGDGLARMRSVGSMDPRS